MQHNVLIVSPSEMNQAAVMVIANCGGNMSDSSLLPLRDTDTGRPTLKRTKKSWEGRRNGWNEWQKDKWAEGREKVRIDEKNRWRGVEINMLNFVEITIIIVWGIFLVRWNASISLIAFFYLPYSAGGNCCLAQRKRRQEIAISSNSNDSYYCYYWWTSSISILLAYLRFTAIQGHPRKVWSDRDFLFYTEKFYWSKTRFEGSLLVPQQPEQSNYCRHCCMTWNSGDHASCYLATQEWSCWGCYWSPEKSPQESWQRDHAQL